jgi:hypothetical protein
MSRLTVLLGLALFTAGCSEESLRKMADKDDLAMSEQFIRDIQTGNDAGALKVVDPDVQKGLVAELPNLRSLLSKDLKAKITLTGTSFKKATELGKKPIDVADLDFDFGEGSDVDVIKIQIAKSKGSRTISMISVNPVEASDEDK